MRPGLGMRLGLGMRPGLGMTLSGNETGPGNETRPGDETVSGNETGPGDETVSGNETGPGDETVSGNETRLRSKTSKASSIQTTRTNHPFRHLLFCISCRHSESLDTEVCASGFTTEMQQNLQQVSAISSYLMASISPSCVQLLGL